MSSAFKIGVSFPNSIRFLVVVLTLIPTVKIVSKGENLWVIILLALLMVIVFFMRLQLEIDKMGFRFRLRMFHFKTYEVKWAEVESVQVVNANPIGDFLGLRYNPQYGWSYVMQDGPMIAIKLKNGKKRAFTVGDNQVFIDAFLECLDTKDSALG